MIKSVTKESDRIDIVQHKWLSKINKKLLFENNEIYYDGIKVPQDILTASLVKYGDQSRFSAYINGWVTNLKTKQYENISEMYPFFLDGTLFLHDNINFDDLIAKYWPNISNGVRKKVANLFRINNKYQLFVVSLFDFDPNTAIKALDLINDQNDTLVKFIDLDFLINFKHSKFFRMLNIKNYNNFAKLIKNDNDWYHHLISIYESTSSIWDVNPSTKIQMFYPLNDMAAYCNKIKSAIGKYKTIFNKYIHMYEFFDGIEISGLTVKIPRDNMDLANWGYDLHNCVGGAGYVEMCYTCAGEKLLFMLEKDKKPYIIAYVNKNEPIQIFIDNNICLTTKNKELHNEIFKFGQAVLNQDINYLKPYISQLHLYKKANQYKERGWLSSDNELSKMMLPLIKDNI